MCSICSTGQRKGKRHLREICGCPASWPWLRLTACIFLVTDTMQVIGTRYVIAGDGNHCMGVLKLPNGAIVELKLGID